MNSLTKPILNIAQAAIAAMAIMHENEAVRRLYIGDYSGMEGKLRTADYYWSVALEHIGTDGAQWDRRVS